MGSNPIRITKHLPKHAVFEFVALGIQDAKRMRHIIIVIFDPFGCTMFFPHYLKNLTIF